MWITFNVARSTDWDHCKWRRFDSNGAPALWAARVIHTVVSTCSVDISDVEPANTSHIREQTEPLIVTNWQVQCLNDLRASRNCR